MFGFLFGSGGSRRTTGPAEKGRARLGLEGLEDRSLPAPLVTFDPTTGAALLRGSVSQGPKPPPPQPARTVTVQPTPNTGQMANALAASALAIQAKAKTAAPAKPPSGGGASGSPAKTAAVGKRIDLGSEGQIERTRRTIDAGTVRLTQDAAIRTRKILGGPLTGSSFRPDERLLKLMEVAEKSAAASGFNARAGRTEFAREFDAAVRERFVGTPGPRLGGKAQMPKPAALAAAYDAEFGRVVRARAVLVWDATHPPPATQLTFDSVGNYTVSHVIASRGQGRTAAEATALLQRDPGRFFPFPFEGGPIEDGRVYRLSPVSVGPLHVISGELRAEDVTPTSFTLRVLTPGYIVSPGSTITFRAVETAGGELLLQQEAHLNGDNPVARALDNLGAPSAWREQPTRLRNAL